MVINRAKLREMPLDEDCKKAKTTTHEFGPDDNRCFCHGLVNPIDDEHLNKCYNCKAFVYNAEVQHEKE